MFFTAVITRFGAEDTDVSSLQSSSLISPTCFEPPHSHETIIKGTKAF